MDSKKRYWFGYDKDQHKYYVFRAQRTLKIWESKKDGRVEVSKERAEKYPQIRINEVPGTTARELLSRKWGVA